MSEFNAIACTAVLIARREAGVTQTETLIRAGWPIQLATLGQMERGKAIWRFDIFERIAKALGHDPLELLNRAAATFPAGVERVVPADPG